MSCKGDSEVYAYTILLNNVCQRSHVCQNHKQLNSPEINTDIQNDVKHVIMVTMWM